MFRRDLIIGIICSVLLHAGLGLGGEINLNFFSKKKVAKKDDAPVIQIEMPKMEPEPPEPAADSEGSSEVTSLAPPSVADVPGVVSLDSFVQAVEPPPPPKTGMTMTIPKSSGPVTNDKFKEVFDLRNLDQKPVPRFQTAPVYPFEMRRNGTKGTVLVTFIVDNNGDVCDARVVRSSNPAFESSALETIYKWKFRPGKMGGRAVNTRNVQQLFEFNLNE